VMPNIDPGELERLHADAFSWARTCAGGRREEAEDVLQTAYLEIYDGRARFDGRSSLRTWLFGIIHNVARSRWRRIARMSQRLLAVDETVDLDTPESRQGYEEDRARVLAAWRALPARQREVLDLVFYRELTLAEAAGVMGISTGSAAQHYERAKSRLRGELGAGRER